MGAVKSPVDRYPGSKRLFVKAIAEDAPIVDAIIEPFAGAAHYSLFRAQGGSQVGFLYWGETDPTLRALYKVWATASAQPKFKAEVEQWKIHFQADVTVAWSALSFAFNEAWSQKRSRDEDAYIYEAAVGSVLRKLTFGGIVRRNEAGEQNAPYCRGQLQSLAKWTPTLEGLDIAQMAAIAPNYKQAIARFQTSGLFSAEAFIDPPYYMPREDCPRLQTPAYWGHKPHDKGTLALCLDAFGMCLADNRILRVVVTNYASKALNDGLQAIAKQYGLDVEFKAGRSLKTMQRRTHLTDGAKQGLWEVRRSPKTTGDFRRDRLMTAVGVF